MKSNCTVKGNLAVKNTRDAHRIQCETYIKGGTIIGGELHAVLPTYMLRLPDYQRSEKNKVRKIAANWQEHLCMPLLISYRDTDFWIIDGQQRWRAAQIAGIESLRCIVLTGLTTEKEVYLYTHQDDNKTQISVAEKLYADKTCGLEPANTIFKICDRNGITINFNGQRRGGVLSYMSKVKGIYEKNGEDGLDWVFKTIQLLGWAKTKNGYSSYVLATLGNVYNQHKQDASEAQRKIVNICTRTNGGVIYTPTRLVSEAMRQYPGCGQTLALTSFFCDLCK